MGMAALPYPSHTTEVGPQLTDLAADPPPAAGIDRAAAALYGPPDRQPQAWLEEGLDGGRGQARDYLEESAASRLLARGTARS